MYARTPCHPAHGIDAVGGGPYNSLRMSVWIAEVIERFGGRPPGSPAEAAAQAWLAGQWGAWCDGVETQPFTAALTAKFHALKWFCLLFYLCLGLYWLVLPAATWLAAFNAIIFLGHFVAYRDWLDPLYRRSLSLNVIGTLEPSEAAQRSVLIAGHMDSVHEFQWWYRLGHWGAVLTVVSGFLIGLQPVFYGLAWGLHLSGTVAGHALGALFVLLAPITAVYFTLHGPTLVDGAIDNLSGVAIADGVGRHFVQARAQGNGLRRTRLRLISFGSEEAGLKGSYAYARAYAAQLWAEGAVLVNVDSIRSAESLFIATSEPNLLVRYPRWLIDRLLIAFQAAGVSVQTAAVTIGASDGASFARRGLPAVTIFGLNPKRLDPTYHTRLDTLDNLDPASLSAVECALIQFIEAWDQADDAPSSF